MISRDIMSLVYLCLQQMLCYFDIILSVDFISCYAFIGHSVRSSVAGILGHALLELGIRAGFVVNLLWRESGYLRL